MKQTSYKVQVFIYNFRKIGKLSGLTEDRMMELADLYSEALTGKPCSPCINFTRKFSSKIFQSFLGTYP